MCFNHFKLQIIVDSSNFAVVNTPTSVEVGEGINAKFSCLYFASLKDSCLRVPTSQLVGTLCWYGVLLMDTVLRYGRYGSLVMVAL